MNRSVHLRTLGEELRWLLRQQEKLLGSTQDPLARGGGGSHGWAPEGGCSTVEGRSREPNEHSG